MKRGRITVLVLLTFLLGSTGINAQTGKTEGQTKETVSESVREITGTVILEQAAPPEPVFSSDVTVDAETGWHVVTLSVNHPDEPRKNITAKITPEGGSTLFSLQVGGIEFLESPDSLKNIFNGGCGMPIMYPTPNRVKDQRYIFNGKWYTMTVPGEEGKRRLHGIVRDDTAWQFEQPSLVDDGVRVRTWYAIDKDNPRFQAFPFTSTLLVEFKVTESTLVISYRVLNRGGIQMAYGFGLHPFWKTLGGRENIRIQSDLRWRMEADENLIPTGELIPLASTPYDLRNPRALTEIMGFDDVYYGLLPESTLRIYYDALHINLDIKGTQDFSHVVLYTPDRDYFCLENQTCSTDVFNLYAKGMGQRAGLRTLNPGKLARGSLEYSFEYTN